MHHATTRVAGIVIAGLGILHCTIVRAGVPTYDTIQLQARSNFSGAYNLPNAAFFTNSTTDINNVGEVTFKISVIAGSDSQGVWFGRNGSGSIAHLTPAGASISDTTINNSARIVYSQIFASPEGLYVYNAHTDSNGFLTSRPIGASGWGTPEINDDGIVGYRASFLGDHAYVSYNGEFTPPFHAFEADVDPISPYSFLFTPSTNNQRNIAGKVRLGASGEISESQPDEIHIFDETGASTLIAEDVDANALSPFDSFDNSVSLNNDDWVAFIADGVGGERSVNFGNGGTVRQAGSTDDPELSDIEFFGPAMNDDRLIVFRAVDASGLQSVWVGDGSSLQRVVTEHDLLDTDAGTARVDQNDSSTVFGGGVRINACGDVTFNAALTPPDNNQIELGSGVFVAYASRTPDGDFDCNDTIEELDAEYFVECQAGIGNPPDSTEVHAVQCTRAFDFDDDNDLDLQDYAMLQQQVSP